MKMPIKDRWNAELYDRSHSFVSEFGNDLVELLAPKKGEKILDIGCGTGDLAYKLNKHGADVIGVDKSANMIHQALKKYPHIPFNVKDVVKLTYENEFNAVFSNATLHWEKKPKQALNCIYHSLKPGGRFVAEFGGKGNVEIITNEILKQLKLSSVTYSPEQFPWYFPSIGEYATLMEEVGFHVSVALHFHRPTPLEGDDGLRNWLEMFAVEMFKHATTETKERIYTSIEKNLRNTLFTNNRWIADYKRIRVVGIKD
ncbi:class I SAM-dependent methyltransferase [Alkalihalobacillus hemicellulosilyticus]|uniref:S-adenosylmethionine-dependent methyltransferase n=1 Tax=Halalkalibacter hemicellulosilyticusJCM 9152 TaxID=1236971 RepID=W4QD33_9BACI|nr:class I SAM-dependent methyltransferase [Halalkalibacter hemicellulosilyticus]GAE29956.1 S-adenosylmethionine-dependent methyltransferase [Halalkalibacter hemicellulosilyticusJCM 9152]